MKGQLSFRGNFKHGPWLISFLFVDGAWVSRSLFNAKNLYDEYLSYDSFIKNNFRRQRAVYNDVEIPFGIEDFKQLTENSYFYFNGNLAKIINFTWVTGKDKANISFWVEENYTKNLQETFIEPQ